MFRLLLALGIAASAARGEEIVVNNQRPIYRVRVMEADGGDLAPAGTIPIGLQGGYLPIGIGGAGIGGAGIGIGGGGFGGGGRFIGGAGGYYPGLVGAGGIGLGGAGIGIGGGGGGQFIGGGGIGGLGGGYIDKHAYSGGKKNLNDLHYEKADGKKGEEYEHGQGGYNQGKTAIKDIKGDSGYYSGEQAGKKLAEDEKHYHGGKQFNQEGKNALEKKEKKGHKKGHVIKGFKHSNHKDETGRTEEYYDEESDEGANFNLHGHQGSFGEKELQAFKGGKEDAEFKAEKGKKEGHHENKHLLDKSDAGHGQYGTKKFGESGALYGINNGVDQHSLLGHQENSKYFKHYPQHVPIFSY